LALPSKSGWATFMTRSHPPFGSIQRYNSLIIG
jgi:hypothetical protein